MRRRLVLGPLAAVTAGAAFALAQVGGAPVQPASWSTRPEVPGAARTLVPFGIETTPQGPRAWALGRAGDGTVVLQRAPGGGWSSARLGTGRPVGGDTAPQHAGELSPDGHGAVLLAPAGGPATLFTRAPGAAFAAAPDPGAAVAADEQLVGGDPSAASARTLLAVVGGDQAATFVAPTTADGTGRAVLRLDGGGWHREPIDAPDPVHPVALAAAGPDRAWLLGTAADRVVLLRRDAVAAEWVPVPFDDALLAGAKVEVSPPPADPLTATADGFWIDLRVTPTGASAAVDLTEHLKVSDVPVEGTPTPTATATTTATATATASATATPTPSASPSATPTAPALAVDGRWCDLPAPTDPAATPLCDHPLGFTFAHGYRSVATAGGTFGTREISAPVDAGVAANVRARDAQRQGGFAALDGDHFVLRDGIGEDGSSTTQAIAFAPDGWGFTGGTIAFGAVSQTPYTPPVEESVPIQGDSLISGAAAPNGDGRIFAITRMFGAVLYVPGKGWSYAATSVTEISSHGRFASPRVVVWPRPNLLIAGGAAGQLASATADPVGVDFGFDEEPLPPQRVINFDALPVEATVLAIACTVTDPLDCVAVGRDGLIVRGDGFEWAIQKLPASAPPHTDITGVAFDGRTPLLATTDGLYRGEPSGGSDAYTRDDDLRARMTAAGLPTAVTKVATVADGGVAVDGRFTRDSTDGPWHATSAPLALFPYALAAYREANGTVRSIVSATQDGTPLPEPVEPDDDDRNPPEDGRGGRHETVPLAPSPIGAVVLRETADGWIDLDRASFQQSGGRDLPDMPVNTRDIVIDGNGTGVLIGGVSDQSTALFYIGGPDAPTLGAEASVRRIDHGVLAAPTPVATEAAETPLPPASVRIAIGGHPACLDRCAAAGGQGYAPDIHLQSALARIRAMTAGGAGPAALLIGGGRASVGGDPLDPGGARRYRQLTQGAGVPTYVLPGPGDLPNGGATAFADAFASAPAPQGTGDAPAGIDVGNVLQPGVEESAGHNMYAFDVRAAAGTVRVVAIDNAAGRLVGGSDGAQARWIRSVLDQAHAQGIPSIVVGSLPLDESQAAKPAEDASEEIALLAGHASAYVATAGVDDPADPHFGGVLSQSSVTAPGAAAGLAVLQSSTLGYAPAQNFTNGPVDIDEATRQTDTALLMLDVAVGRIDPTTGVAPVDAISEPLLTGLSLDQSSRVVPLGWASQLYVRAADPSPTRFLMRPSPDDDLQPASPGISGLLIDQCRFFVRACNAVVPTDMNFASANPQIARFVAVRPGDEASRGRPQVILDPSGHVVDDPRGFLCPLALGSVDVSVTALGQRVTSSVRVIPVPKIDEGNVLTDPIPAGTCGFPSFTRNDDEPKPVATPEVPATVPPPTAPAAAPAPHQPQAHHQPAHHHAVPPAPVPVPAPAPPVVAVPPPPPVPAAPPATDPAHPPVVPAAKPPVPPAPPAPPQGLQVQQAQAPQTQPFQAMQQAEQRREEYAYESDSAAIAYAHPPSPWPWEVAGGVALLALVMAGGTLAGRARSRTAVPATVTVEAARRRVR